MEITFTPVLANIDQCPKTDKRTPTPQIWGAAMAERLRVPVVLADRDISITLKRSQRLVSIWGIFMQLAYLQGALLMAP